MSTNNFLKEILQGGACNSGPNNASIHNSNPVKNFINYAILGKAQVRQRGEVFYPDEEPINQEAHSRDVRPQAQVRGQNMEKKGEAVRGLNERREMEGIRKEWQNEEKKWEKGIKIAEIKEQKLRDRERGGEYGSMLSQQQAREGEMRAFMQWNEARQFQMANQMQWKMYSKEVLGGSGNYENMHVRDRVSERSKCEDNLMRGSMEQVASLMRNDPDPRFKNSKYLEFLEKGEKQKAQGQVNSTKAEVMSPEVLEEEKQNNLSSCEKNDDQLMEEMEAVWKQEEEKLEHDPKAEDPESKQEDVDPTFEDVWKTIEDQFNNESKSMTSLGSGSLEKVSQRGSKAELDGTGQEEVDEEEGFDLGLESEYRFCENNPYMNQENCLESAVEFLNLGQSANAVLCLEAVLQKSGDNLELWNLLGKIYQDNDQEKQALDCLLKAVKLDSKNIDALLVLSVALTNKADEVRAMKCMKRWLQCNPKYKQMALKDPRVKEIVFDKGTSSSLRASEIDLINRRLRQVFEKISHASPSDPEVFSSLALLNFIARDYNASLHYFDEALKYDPKNYSLWNKLGATLAHLGKSNEAISAYYRALEFKPNYVRAWVNLGVSQAYKGEYEEAVRLYLSALSLNPEAEHIWNHLRNTLVVLNRYDLSKKAGEKDLETFKKEFDVISFEDLPPPEIEYKELNSKFLIKKTVEQWVAEF